MSLFIIILLSISFLYTTDKIVQYFKYKKNENKNN